MKTIRGNVRIRCLDDIASLVEVYAEDALRATGTPGGVVAIGDGSGALVELAFGHCNLASETMMQPT
ncbi:hypothetical protein ACWCQZ_51235, partial [Streptomyces sp. NPDC002285]